MFRSVLRQGGAFFSGLVRPHSHVVDAEDRAQSRLLAGIQLVTIALGIFILAFVVYLDPYDLNRLDTLAAAVYVIGAAGLYLANRVGYWRWSARSFVLLSLAVFLVPPYLMTTAPWLLAFAIIPVLLTGYFFSLKWVIISSIGLVGTTFVLNRLIIDDLNFWTYQNLWYFQLTACAFIITLVAHLQTMERIHYDALEEANQRLRDSQKELVQHRSDLEVLIEERTADLKEANRQLEELTRVKDQFVSNVSHELRTPIASMKILHKLIELRADRREDYHQALGRDIERLNGLIEDLLRLSRLDQGSIELQLEPIELSALTAEYVTDRSLLAQERGITLVFAEPADPLLVMADKGLLGQVLSILLTNAINYTPANGKVSVSMRLAEDGSEPSCGVCVEDTGPGISADDVPHIFERFYRGVTGLKSGMGGTGLGLSIADEIVRRHGGTIEVSADGVREKGTAFTVWLPCVDA